MMKRRVERTAKIAMFAVAHSVYWEQFPGLHESLSKNHKKAIEKVEANQVDVVDFGIVDSSINAFKIADKINAINPDLVICNMVTYATSSVFTPIIQRVNSPFILLAVQPRKALDYSIASTFMQLENDAICSVPEFINVAKRFNKKIHDVIIGTLSDDLKVDEEIAEWCDVAKVLNGLRGARIGLMGHVLESMYDMHVDPTLISAKFGVHVPLLEFDSLVECYENVTEDEIVKKIAVINKEFEMPDPKSDPLTMKLTDEDLYESAKGAVALDNFVSKYKLDGIAYYYEGREDSIERKVTSSLIVGNSLLNAQGIPMCGEFDLKTNLAMFIMDKLEIGGSFAEFHPFDFTDNTILIGHDGPHHIKIANGKPILRSLKKFHGKPGNGASVEIKLREGPITMLGITVDENGKLLFVLGEGFSQAGPIPPTGNTNTRGYFPPDTVDFVKRWCLSGPTHHFALGIGHKAATIEKVAACLDIESVVII